MNEVLVAPAMTPVVPRLWRMVLIAVSTIILCSCRATPNASNLPGPSPTLPQQAFTGAPEMAPAPCPAPLGPPGMELGVPVAEAAAGPWAPPGVSQPWPHDEYICDGGDHGVIAVAASTAQVQGIGMKDTVAVFNTEDGRTLVEPSNRVCIYSPRFRAVRQVVAVVEDEQMDASTGMYLPVGAVARQQRDFAGQHKQNLQTVRQIGNKSLTTLRTKQGDGVVSTAIVPQAVQDALLPFEDAEVIRTGQLKAADHALIARGTLAAVKWTHAEGVEVLIEGQMAGEAVKVQNAPSLYTIEEHPKHPKLRIVKVASTQVAEPGDIVHFTLRFDNVGTQVLNNVTILDSLTTRLEYVPDSAQASVAAQFSTSRNEGDSLVLRWEITEPVQPGKGGVLRFLCRVR